MKRVILPLFLIVAGAALATVGADTDDIRRMVTGLISIGLGLFGLYRA